LIFQAILDRAPTPPIRLNPDLPPKLEDIISKALEKDRNLRYQHAADIRTDLQRLKRDTDTGRAAAISSGSIPIAQETSAPHQSPSGSSAKPVAASSPSAPAAAAASASASAVSTAVAAQAPRKSRPPLWLAAGAEVAVL